MGLAYKLTDRTITQARLFGLFLSALESAVIKRIELVNFMSHPHTVIEPARGLTVLVGPNNCGKSAVVTALQVLAHNEPSKYVLRHNERQCRVRVETADDHVIEWHRGKNKTPYYVIDGREFDRLRRSVPDELDRALRLPKVDCDSGEIDVHFAEQKSPVFLLNESARTAAEFFASSSDASHLMEMQNLHKQKVRDARSEQKRLGEETEALSAEIVSLEAVDDLRERLIRCETEFAELCRQGQALDRLRRYISEIGQAHVHFSWMSAITIGLDALPRPPDLDETNSLERLIARKSSTSAQIERLASECRILDQLAPPPELFDEAPLAGSIVNMQSVAALFASMQSAENVVSEIQSPPEFKETDAVAKFLSDISEATHCIENIDRQLDRLGRQLNEIQDSVNRWASANPTCPTCSRPIEVQRLLARRVESKREDRETGKQ